MKKIDWLIFFFIILTSVYTLKDLFIPGFYTSHDGPHQIVRLYYFDQAIKSGQFPPRWASGLLNGFGYPLFIFSYHLPWFMAELLHLSGLSIIDSVKMTFLLGFILSGITMFIFQKEMFGRLAAFVGTFVYLFAPYRFSNIYVRAAIGDATAFIFPPLLFWGIYKLKQSRKIIPFWIAISAIAMAGLLLSHAMVFLFFFLAYGLYFLISVFFTKEKVRLSISWISTILLGFGISSYYFIPSIIERNNTKFTDIMGSAFTGNTFLKFQQLLYSSWGYGMMNANEGGMSFQVGIVQWLIVLIVIIILLHQIVSKKLNSELIFYPVLFFLSIVLMFQFSLPFWKLLSKIALIDFTWRILPVTVFAASVLGGILISKVKFPYLAAFLIIFIALYTNRNHLRINQSLDWSIPFYLKLEKTTNSYDEYTPKWVNQGSVEKPKPKIEFMDGTGEIKMQNDTPYSQEFLVETVKPVKLRINTIYYPGWNVNVNGKLQKIDYDQGLIEFPLNQGNSQISVYFTETPLRTAANLISLASFVIAGLFLLRYKRT